MTGPEHYREAERLLNATKYAQGGPAAEALLTAKAQAHATLALAAATALQPSKLAVGRPEWKAWAGAALTEAAEA